LVGHVGRVKGEKITRGTLKLKRRVWPSPKNAFRKTKARGANNRRGCGV